MNENEKINKAISDLTDLGYKFTRPLVSRINSIGNGTHNSNLAKAIILDTETTGFDYKTDKIIELGMLLFEYDPKNGHIHNVIDVFNELEDPGTDIPSESIKIHGITNQMVSSKSIDDQAVFEFIKMLH